MMLSLSIDAFGQANDSTIYWSSTPLKWKDFRGPIPINRTLQGNIDTERKKLAETFSSVSYLYHIKSDTLQYCIYSYFNKNISWTVSNSKYDLMHEQGHFNISEIVARRLKQFLNNKSINIYIPKKTLKNTIDSICNSTYSLEDTYDYETDYGSDTLAQKKWNVYIKHSLDSLAKYEKINGIIKLKK